MSAPAVKQLDLTAPPIVKTIGQRSLIVGVVFGLIALILAFLRPEKFFRAYLLGFMCWMCVCFLCCCSRTLFIFRHLTGGGWGMIIRRILGAAMRTLPLLALLFIPIFFGLPRLYVWARPLDSIPDQHLREHLQQITQTYLSVNGFVIRAVIYFAIWGALVFFLTKWSAEQDNPPSR